MLNKLPGFKIIGLGSGDVFFFFFFFGGGGGGRGG